MFHADVSLVILLCVRCSLLHRKMAKAPVYDVDSKGFITPPQFIPTVQEVTCAMMMEFVDKDRQAVFTPIFALRAGGYLWLLRWITPQKSAYDFCRTLNDARIDALEKLAANSQQFKKYTHSRRFTKSIKMCPKFKAGDINDMCMLRDNHEGNCSFEDISSTRQRKKRIADITDTEFEELVEDAQQGVKQDSGTNTSKKARTDGLQSNVVGLCSVCLDDEKPLFIAAPCGHKNCHECINKLTKKQCPECRAKVTCWASAYKEDDAGPSGN